MDESRRKRLNAEIACLVDTLLALEENKTQPKLSITDHTKRISTLLPIVPMLPKRLNHYCFPIHQLLSAAPLANTEIPLDILEMLIGEFNVNELNINGMSCLNIAIHNEHYNAVRCLLENDSDCRMEARVHTIVNRISPIALLAHKSNAPLELFDLLQTPQTLNGDMYNHLPLHEALKCGHSKAALHLIQLGASVDKGYIFRSACHGVFPPLNVPVCGFLNYYYAGWGLPIEHYAKRYTHQFDERLFEKLVPSNGIKILQSIGSILKDENTKRASEIGYKLIQQLVQQRKQVDFLSVDNSFASICGFLKLYTNKKLFMSESTLKGRYLINLLLSHLNWNIVSTRRFIDEQPVSLLSELGIRCVHAIECIWDSYEHKPKVNSLLTLCIQQTRKHMNSLTNNSFMSLPVPKSIRRLLMLTDIADALIEAWLLWPDCSPAYK